MSEAGSNVGLNGKTLRQHRKDFSTTRGSLKRGSEASMSE